MYLNKALIFGNITKDPESKSLPSGIQVVSFSVATNRVWKDKNGVKQESVDYHNIVVFGKQAEFVSQYMKKGSSIFVEGRMQTRSWDGPDGTKRYRTEVVADRVQFGPRKGEGGGGNYQPADTNSKKEKTNEDVPEIQYPDEEINIEDIPF